MKIRYILAIITATLSVFVSSAGKPSEDLVTHVNSLHMQCPFEIGEEGWIVQAIQVNSDALSVTITANVDPNLFDEFKNGSCASPWIKNYISYGENWRKLVELTSQSSIPLTIDIITLDGSDTISLSYSISDLKSITQ